MDNRHNFEVICDNFNVKPVHVKSGKFAICGSKLLLQLLVTLLLL